MYCLKYKKDTKDLNVKAFITKNNRHMLKANLIFVKVKNQNLFQKKILLDLVFYAIYFQKYPFYIK